MPTRVMLMAMPVMISGREKNLPSLEFGDHKEAVRLRAARMFVRMVKKLK